MRENKRDYSSNLEMLYLPDRNYKTNEFNARFENLLIGIKLWEKNNNFITPRTKKHLLIGLKYLEKLKMDLDYFKPEDYSNLEQSLSNSKIYLFMISVKSNNKEEDFNTVITLTEDILNDKQFDNDEYKKIEEFLSEYVEI